MLLQSWLAKWRHNAAHLVGKLRGNRRPRRSTTAPTQSEVLESRCLLTTATVSLGNLGLGGITINGIDASDVSGRAVAGIGDFNGDGYDDVLIGAVSGDGVGNAKSNSGESYVVFGRADWSAMPTLELSTLDGTNGIILYGVDANDYSGWAVSAAGDVNGDGFNDLMIGSYFAAGIGNTKAGSGETYVVFGKSSWTASPTVNLGALNGTNGFTLYGADAGDRSGIALSAAGDVNGDGYADMLIGAPGGDGAGNAKDASGESYVVFGKANWSSTPSVNLGALNGTNGFTLYGVDLEDESGKAVGSAGDINGDGFADLIIGAPSSDGAGNLLPLAGESYVVFGKANWASTPTLNLSSLNGTNGFILYGIDAGDLSGTSVGSAGDFNGDGFDDFVIGATSAAGVGNLSDNAGESYVVFGKASWAGTPTVNLSSLNGTNGIILVGIDPADASGTTINGIGDLNGDGFDDILISANFGRGPNNDINDTGTGESYVVYGKADWSATAIFALSTLDGSNGFTIYGADPYDQSGKWSAAAGDFNGDGFPDLLIGAPNSAGADNNTFNTGATYVVFGGNFTSSATQVGTTASETLTGTSGVDNLVGGGGNDILIGGGGADVLYGGSGDDILIVADTNFGRVNGGNGNDTLKFSGSGMSLNLITTPNSRIKNIEIIDIRGSGPNTLILNAASVLNLTQNSNPGHTANTLQVRRDANDTVTIGSGWTQGADQIIGGLTYNVYTQGAAKLLLEVVGQFVPDVTLSIDHSTMAEAGGTATITAMLQEISNVDVTVTLGFNGTANFPADYSRSAAQIVIPAGNLTGSVTLTAVDDSIVEAAETIVVSITGVTNGLQFGANTVSTQIIDDDNHAPTFTTSATPSIPENTTAVMTVIALDTDLPAQTVTYSLTGGADQNLFSITSGGVLTFKTARDFETPGDVGGNNVYEVQVTANDGHGGLTTQNISVTVTNLDDVPVADLTLPPQTITWINKQTPAIVLPQLTVTSSGNLSGSTLTITMNAKGTKKTASDMLSIPSSSSIGTSSALVYANGRLTQVITLNQNATAAGIQAFLRGIRFSTKGSGLALATRRLDATLAIAGGTTETVSQTINVLRKAPRVPRVRNR
ncbi:MAG: Calx-beta domain-containing protein [Planctomycetota bacterium]